MKKITFLTSFVALTFAVPAMAVPSNTSSTFPSDGFMEEDYTYQNQATVTNLKVSEGTATTTASYTDCPSGYPNSDAGATSTDQCYKDCTTADLADPQAVTATGKNYYGANETDTCAIATCNSGYHLNPGKNVGNPDLTTLIGISGIVTEGGYKNEAGYTVVNGSTYNITQNGEFVVDYGNKGKIHGFGLCGSQIGSKGSMSNGTFPNITTMSTLPDANGKYCWCKLDGYTPDGGTMQSMSGPWVAMGSSGDSYGMCSSGCTSDCLQWLKGYSGRQDYFAFRAAMFNATDPIAPSCDGNEIQITWANASAADINANNAGTVIYGGDINTPKKAQHQNGKFFIGWSFGNAQ